MPFITINGLSVLATFDGSSARSSLPVTAMDYLHSASLSPGPFLVTAPTAKGSFSASLTFLRGTGGTAKLGLDWFAYVREFYIAQGEDPPTIASFSLASSCKC